MGKIQKETVNNSSDMNKKSGRIRLSGEGKESQCNAVKWLDPDTYYDGKYIYRVSIDGSRHIRIGSSDRQG